MKTLRRFAPAKVNLGLAVTGRLPNGYHELHSIVAALSIGDTLSFTPDKHLSLEVRGAHLPTDERNLVYRAAKRYLQAAGETRGARIVLEKRLPLASGLGGGSSDAATTLKALSDLYPAPLDLTTLAAELGADVPFFLGPPAALMQGYGERLSPLTLPPLHVLLLNIGVEVSAADAYRWRSGPYDSPLDIGAVVKALPQGEPAYFNGLERGVFGRHPEILRAKEELRALGLRGALMSGSGSTVFALADNEAQAKAAAEQLRRPGRWVDAATLLGG